MADNESSTSSYVVLIRNAFVKCSTYVEVVILELLEYMAERNKANRSPQFIISLSMKRGLNDKLAAWCTDYCIRRIIGGAFNLAAWQIIFNPSKNLKKAILAIMLTNSYSLSPRQLLTDLPNI